MQYFSFPLHFFYKKNIKKTSHFVVTRESPTDNYDLVEDNMKLHYSAFTDPIKYF